MAWGGCVDRRVPRRKPCFRTSFLPDRILSGFVRLPRSKSFTGLSVLEELQNRGLDLLLLQQESVVALVACDHYHLRVRNLLIQFLLLGQRIKDVAINADHQGWLLDSG
eukprot:scaffold1954_cov268-Pinguiococcus_pyrenoidosus.AAC.238